jgi:hypothetical protein
MRHTNLVLVVLVSVLAGVAGTLVFAAPALNHLHHLPNLAAASGSGSNDRYQDYIMCTGAVAINPRAPTDGVWMLDYRSGKLLGTVIDRTVGKIQGWAEVDLVAEFGIAPKADVHFMMTTGTIAQGQAALYVAEVTSGKFGIYTMGPAADLNGIIIRRHDLTTFRAAKPAP